MIDNDPGPAGPPQGDPWAAPGHPAAQQPGIPPVYGAPVPPSMPSFPHAEPTPYHLMLRTWTYEPWKPIVGICLAVGGFLIGSALVYIVVAGVAAVVEGGDWIDNFMASADMTDVKPATLLGLNLAIGSMIFFCWFLVRVLHNLRPRWLASVAPKMRWKFFFACLGLSVIALLAQVLVGTVLPGDANGVTGKLNDFSASTLAFAFVVLLTTPLQAAGEEYLFRGYLLQAVGALFRNRWVAVGVTGLLFALAHGAQNFPLFFDRLAFGLIAAWLVTATGGLEAGIALHVLNNVLAFGLALSYGDLSETLNVSEASWWNIPLTLTQSAVYAVLVLYVARRTGVQTHTQPPPPETGTTASPDLATA